MAKRKKKTISLGPLEGEVMKIVWDRGEVSADDVRIALGKSRELKDSTVRTLMRRLEAKGAVAHRVEGRTFIYHAPMGSEEIAVDAVKSIVSRFCEGSLSNLLLGMADDKQITANELRKLADLIDQQNK